MWNDPIVEETRRLREEFAAKHRHSIHAMIEDLKQWERQGFPLLGGTPCQSAIPPLSAPQQPEGASKPPMP